MCTNLVRSGATLNQNVEDEKLPLFISAKNGHYELSQWMIQEGADDRKCLDPLLYCYAKHGDHQLCRNMLDRGADPSYPGCLQIAIDLYHTDVAQLLIEHPKAKVNQVRKCGFHCKREIHNLYKSNFEFLKEFKGLTALMYAAKNSASGKLSKNETYPKPLIFVE